jgi:hypothetical protein
MEIPPKREASAGCEHRQREAGCKANSRMHMARPVKVTLEAGERPPQVGWERQESCCENARAAPRRNGSARYFVDATVRAEVCSIRFARHTLKFVPSGTRVSFLTLDA